MPPRPPGCPRTPPVSWRRGPSTTPFTEPFAVSAHQGKLWIAPADEAQRPGARWDELHLRGTNWAGFQVSGCVHELWKFEVQDYLSYLTVHGFNAVRLPLAAPLILQSADEGGFIVDDQCGEYAGLDTLDVLDDVLRRLQRAGIFVMLDMHVRRTTRMVPWK